MADFIVAPPLEKVIPVTRGCDRAFTIQRTDGDGGPVNFDAGSEVYMWVDVDRDDPTRVDAVVDGATAAFVLPDSLCDQVTKSTRWRVVLDRGESEIPLLVGKFERYDG